MLSNAHVIDNLCKAWPKTLQMAAMHAQPCKTRLGSKVANLLVLVLMTDKHLLTR